MTVIETSSPSPAATTPPPASAATAATAATAVAWLVRARAATTAAIVRSFAVVRAGQAIALQRGQAWLTAADGALTRSLATGEQFLLSRLAPPPSGS